MPAFCGSIHTSTSHTNNRSVTEAMWYWPRIPPPSPSRRLCLAARHPAYETHAANEEMPDPPRPQSAAERGHAHSGGQGVGPTGYSSCCACCWCCTAQLSSRCCAPTKHPTAASISVTHTHTPPSPGRRFMGGAGPGGGGENRIPPGPESPRGRGGEARLGGHRLNEGDLPHRGSVNKADPSH